MIALTLLVILYLLGAFFITRWLAKRVSSKKAKWGVGAGGALLFFLIPTWDHLLGSLYFNYLCGEEGGIKIYKTVELGPEYYLQSGEIDYNTAGRLPAKGGEIDRTLLGKELITFSNRWERNFSDTWNIAKDTDMVSLKNSGEVLGTRTAYVHFGGWLVNSTGAHVTGRRCHGYLDGEPESVFLHSVFKAAKSVK